MVNEKGITSFGDSLYANLKSPFMDTIRKYVGTPVVIQTTVPSFGDLRYRGDQNSLLGPEDSFKKLEGRIIDFLGKLQNLNPNVYSHGLTNRYFSILGYVEMLREGIIQSDEFYGAKPDPNRVNELKKTIVEAMKNHLGKENIKKWSKKNKDTLKDIMRLD